MKIYNIGFDGQWATLWLLMVVMSIIAANEDHDGWWFFFFCFAMFAAYKAADDYDDC